VVLTKCEKALNGTELLIIELAVLVLATVPAETGESAFGKAVKVLGAGVYSAVVVSAFDPADGEVVDENDDYAALPLVPFELLP